MQKPRLDQVCLGNAQLLIFCLEGGIGKERNLYRFLDRKFTLQEIVHCVGNFLIFGSTAIPVNTLIIPLRNQRPHITETRITRNRRAAGRQSA